MISGFNLTFTRREKRQGMKLCSGLRTICDLACVAWRFWLGALSNKGGLGQRNREEIGVGATYFYRGFAARSRALCARISRLRRSCAPCYTLRGQCQTVLPLPSSYALFKVTLSHLPWKSRQAWYNSATVLANKELPVHQ